MTDAESPRERPTLDAAVGKLLHDAVAGATPSGRLLVAVRSCIEAPDVATT